MAREDLLKGLTKEQINKARECNSTAELLELAKQEGVELSEEQLKAISGGCGEPVKIICPMCQSEDVDAHRAGYDKQSRGVTQCTCRHCGWTWEILD